MVESKLDGIAWLKQKLRCEMNKNLKRCVELRLEERLQVRLVGAGSCNVDPKAKFEQS